MIASVSSDVGIAITVKIAMVERALFVVKDKRHCKEEIWKKKNQAYFSNSHFLEG